LRYVEYGQKDKKDVKVIKEQVLRRAVKMKRPGKEAGMMFAIRDRL
jgi:hypothetical protein